MNGWLIPVLNLLGMGAGVPAVQLPWRLFSVGGRRAVSFGVRGRATVSFAARGYGR